MGNRIKRIGDRGTLVKEIVWGAGRAWTATRNNCWSAGSVRDWGVVARNWDRRCRIYKSRRGQIGAGCRKYRGKVAAD